MFLNANLYTWSYRVAEWAWEAELAQEVADAIMDTSGGEALSISETAAEIGGLAAGSVLGALMLAPLELLLDLDREVEHAAMAADADDHGAADADAAAIAIDKDMTAPIIVAAAKSHASRDAMPQPTPTPVVRPVVTPVIASSIAPVIAPSIAPVIAPIVSLAPPPPTAPTPAEAARGRWVLKGYRTEIAFSVHTDPNKMDLAFQANEQSGADIDNKARARRPVAADGVATQAWHDRGPESE